MVLDDKIIDCLLNTCPEIKIERTGSYKMKKHKVVAQLNALLLDKRDSPKKFVNQSCESFV